MTSALDIINDGATFAGVGDLYNSLKAEESSLGLRLLNNLTASEGTQEYTIYDTTEGLIPLSVGVAQYLLGPGGTTILVNPTWIDTKSVTVVDSSGFTHSMREQGQADWANISWKAQPGRPALWFYDQHIPDSTMNVWPTPSFAGDVLHVWYGTPLQNFANLATVLVAPPGWELYFKTNLGALLAMWFRKQLTDDQKRAVKQSRDFARNASQIIKTLPTNVPADSNRYYYNIYTDNQ